MLKNSKPNIWIVEFIDFEWNYIDEICFVFYFEFQFYTQTHTLTRTHTLKHKHIQMFKQTHSFDTNFFIPKKKKNLDTININSKSIQRNWKEIAEIKSSFYKIKLKKIDSKNSYEQKVRTKEKEIKKTKKAKEKTI